MHPVTANDSSRFGVIINHEPIEIVRDGAHNHAIGIQLILLVGMAAVIRYLPAADLNGNASLNFSLAALVLALAAPYFRGEHSTCLRDVP